MNWIKDLLQDARYGSRMLMKSPGFALIAVLSLAFGIGAGTAVFSLVNAVLLASLPVPNPQELRVINWSGEKPNVGNMNGSINAEAGSDRQIADMFSYPVFASMREAAADQAELFGYNGIDQATVRGRREATTVQGMMIGDNFFAALGIKPELGRLPDAAENAPGGAPVVVVSHRLWQREYALDPGALGQTLQINNQPYTIIGVLPEAIRGVSLNSETDFYVTLAAQPQLASTWPLAATDRWWIKLMARMKPGASEAQLQAELDAAFGREAGSKMKAPKAVIQPGNAGPNWDRDYYRRPLMLLLAIVAIVILVACANLAGLSLARGAARGHEFAVRAAIGAGRWRIVRQSLAESLLLALAGGGLGVALAAWGRTYLGRLLEGRGGGFRYDAPLDLRVLGFALGATVLAALLSGLLPALRNAGASPQAGLKERGALAAPRLAAGKTLVAGQVALSLLLLAGAGLFVRTLSNLVEINPGFRIDHLLLYQINPRAAGYRGQDATRFLQEALDASARLPGVRSAALSRFALLRGMMSGGSYFSLPGRPDLSGKSTQAHRLTVSESYFETMGIRILEGRSFAAADANGAPKVVVVNETFAKKYFGGENPIGQTIEHKNDKSQWTVAGVCADAKYSDIKADVPPTVYYSFRQDTMGSAYVVLRTAVAPPTLIGPARRAIAAIDPNVPLTEISTQQQIRDDKLGQERLFAILCGGLAVLALLLSCVGIYGLMAYNVTRRTGEIGIRMALGAAPGDVARPILREALLLACGGVAIGLPAVWFAVRLVESQLYGVQAHDPATLAAAAGLMIVVAVAAAWLPSRRAARLEPMKALRAE